MKSKSISGSGENAPFPSNVGTFTSQYILDVLFLSQFLKPRVLKVKQQQKRKIEHTVMKFYWNQKLISVATKCLTSTCWKRVTFLDFLIPRRIQSSNRLSWESRRKKRERERELSWNEWKTDSFYFKRIQKQISYVPKTQLS